jgi:threonine/homoserine/homoserine lactone efflux protein
VGEEDFLQALSIVLVVLGLWLIVDGVVSIAKYRKQTFPEQLIRVIRATVGVVIVVVGIVEN